MTFTFGNLLALIGVICGFLVVIAILVLLGVFLGAYFVFKTKKENYESLIGGQPKGEIFSLEDEVNAPEEEFTEDNLPENIVNRMHSFLEQKLDA